jgi:hypothetical protein
MVRGGLTRQSRRFLHDSADPVEPDVLAYLDRIAGPQRRRDAETMLEVMRRATGVAPKMSGVSQGSDKRQPSRV